MRIHNGNRALSNALGFILIFAIVVTSIAVIYTAGYDQLVEVREDEKVQNAERAMFVAKQNLDDIHVRGVPGRGTEMSLKDSTLAITDQTRLTVTVTNTTGTSFSYSVTSRVLWYGTGDGRAVTLELGGLTKTTDAGAVMSKVPPMQFDERSSITMVEIRGSESLGGSTTVYTVFRRSDSGLVVYNDTSGTSDDLSVTVKVDTTPERAVAWKTYFESEGLTPVDATASDGTVAYSYEPNSLVLRKSVIEAHFE